MDTQRLKQFEEELLKIRLQLIKEMGYYSKDVFKETHMNSTGDISAYHSHMADQGTDAMEREKAFMFMSQEGKVLKAVSDALRKIVKKKYGDCESCGETIGVERLEAIPYARLCINCKRAEEEKGKKSRSAYL